MKISRKSCHSPAFINNVPTLVRQLFIGEVQIVMTDMELETLFYVSGWSIHALSKASKHHSLDHDGAMNNLNMGNIDGNHVWNTHESTWAVGDPQVI